MDRKNVKFEKCQQKQLFWKAFREAENHHFKSLIDLLSQCWQSFV